MIETLDKQKIFTLYFSAFWQNLTLAQKREFLRKFCYEFQCSYNTFMRKRQNTNFTPAEQKFNYNFFKSQFTDDVMLELIENTPTNEDDE
ncbi:MAG: hypothetical protein JXR68_12985 [Bacteroidales bacterium]|nr:hypothetical protein [Bacteroidales bacterium]